MNTIIQLIKKRSRECPDKTFLFFKDEKVSYEELEKKSSAIARGFKNQGIVKGDYVALILPNCLQFVYSYFALMKIGAVVVPINPTLKPAEMEQLFLHCQAKMVITIDPLSKVVQEISKKCPSINCIVEVGEQNSTQFINFQTLQDNKNGVDLYDPQGNDIASIIYTSGTTGKPKGVILTHKNYLSDIEMLMQSVKIRDDDRFLCVLPLFHVNGQVATILTPLYAKASVVLTEMFDPKSFFQTISKYKVTTFSAVPTIYSYLLALPNLDHDLSSLRFCICGAAPMSVEVFKQFEKKFNTKILEGYGLSEGTCVSSINPIGEKSKIGSIGLSLPGQLMKVVNDKDEDLPDMQIGEIIIKGDNIMQGYLYDPQTTALTIRNSWLYTGDLGYRDSDGYFFISGRKKELIIRGGQNIYPQEIEEVLYGHNHVQEVAVVGLPNKVWGEEVAAFVVACPGYELKKQDLLDHCHKLIADYKRPRKIIILNSLPKTATGKIRKVFLKEKFA